VREVWASAREFGRKIIRHFIAVAVGVVGGILGVVDAVSAAAAKPGTTPFSIPLWVWLPVLAGGFLVAIFRAFHDVRMERDAVVAEMERRFDAQRYALTVLGLGVDLDPNPDGTGDMTLLFKFINGSPEPLWYTADETTTIIDGQRSVEQPTLPPEGVVIAPQQETSIACDPVRGISVPWRDGSVEFAVRYGYPQGKRRYRQRYAYKLTPPRFTGQPAGHIEITAVQVRNPGVEDIGTDRL
jgi:hypothetical protein